jgi:hypothetical protein
MARFVGPQTVTSGLVLYLDAANTKSYPGSGTTWTDLSGNGNNGTLANGPTYSSANGGQIVFDGSDDNAITSASVGTVSAATFLVWLKRNGSQILFTGILFNRTPSANGLNFYDTTHNIGYHWNNAISTYNWNSGLTVPDAVWCMCAISISSTSATAYLCQSSGITSATNSVSHASATFGIFNIGLDPQIASRCFKGSISSTMIYNRALSADEVAQNFNALRGRFGL